MLILNNLKASSFFHRLFCVDPPQRVALALASHYGGLFLGLSLLATSGTAGFEDAGRRSGSGSSGKQARHVSHPVSPKVLDGPSRSGVERVYFCTGWTLTFSKRTAGNA